MFESVMCHCVWFMCMLVVFAVCLSHVCLIHGSWHVFVVCLIDRSCHVFVVSDS